MTACEVKFYIGGTRVQHQCLEPGGALLGPRLQIESPLTDLAGNELEARVLPELLLLNELVNFGVLILERRVEAGVL